MAVGAILVLLGWIFNPVLLVIPGGTKMMPITAIGFMLVAYALWYRSASVAGTRLVNPWYATVANVCAGLAALIGLLTLVEYVTGVDLGIDTILFRGRLLADKEAYPGRMAPTTALCFSLLGSALLFLDARTRYWRWPAQFFASTVTLTRGTALLGHLFGLRAFYQISSYTAMAMQTSFLFVMLGLGTLLARADLGWMRSYSANALVGYSPGGCFRGSY